MAGSTAGQSIQSPGGLAAEFFKEQLGPELLAVQAPPQGFLDGFCFKAGDWWMFILVCWSLKGEQGCLESCMTWCLLTCCNKLSYFFADVFWFGSFGWMDLGD